MESKNESRKLERHQTESDFSTNEKKNIGPTNAVERLNEEECYTRIIAGTKHAERKALTVVQRTNKVCESGLLGSVYFRVLSRPRTKTSKLAW